MVAAYCPACGKGVSAEIKATGRCAACGKPLPAQLPSTPPSVKKSPVSSATANVSRPASSASVSNPARPASAPAAAAPAKKPGFAPAVLLAWGTVRAGLGLTFLGALLFALCVLLLAVVGLTADPERGTSALALVAAFLSIAGLTVSASLTLAGGCMGCAVPRASGARGWSVAASGLLAVSLVLGILQIVTYLDRSRIEKDNTTHLLQGTPLVQSVWSDYEVQVIQYGFLSSVALCNICYLLFLRGVARSFRRALLSWTVLLFLITTFLFGMGIAVMQSGRVPLPMAIPTSEDLIKLTLAGAGILSLWYVALIGRTRTAITRGILQS